MYVWNVNTKNNDKQINSPGVHEPMFTKQQNNHHQANKLFYLALIATNVAVQFNRFSQLKLTFIGKKTPNNSDLVMGEFSCPQITLCSSSVVFSLNSDSFNTPPPFRHVELHPPSNCDTRHRARALICLLWAVVWKNSRTRSQHLHWKYGHHRLLFLVVVLLLIYLPSQAHRERLKADWQYVMFVSYQRCLMLMVVLIS